MVRIKTGNNYNLFQIGIILNGSWNNWKLDILRPTSCNPTLTCKKEEINYVSWNSKLQFNVALIYCQCKA